MDEFNVLFQKLKTEYARTKNDPVKVHDFVVKKNSYVDKLKATLDLTNFAIANIESLTVPHSDQSHAAPDRSHITPTEQPGADIIEKRDTLPTCDDQRPVPLDTYSRNPEDSTPIPTPTSEHKQPITTFVGSLEFIASGIKYIRFAIKPPRVWSHPYNIKQMSLPDKCDYCAYNLDITSIPPNHIILTGNTSVRADIYIVRYDKCVVTIVFDCCTQSRGNSPIVEGLVIGERVV